MDMRHLHLTHLLGPESFEPGEDASRLPGLLALAKRLEAAGFTALLLPNADGPGAVRQGRPFLPCEPFTACGALAASTRHIGLAVAVAAAVSEPYNVARRLASLDHISRGRIGWNLTGGEGGCGEQYIDHTRPERPLSVERAGEFVDVVRALWDSWSATAITVRADGASAVDGSGNRPIAHQGRWYKVKGPLDVPRPPQGWPVLFQRIETQEDADLAARFADVAIPAATSREALAAFRQDFAVRLGEQGRDAGQVRVMPLVFLGGGERPEEMAAQLGEWFAAGLADGFTLTGPGIRRFPEEILPRLRALAPLAPAGEGVFLGERLGLAGRYGG